jgi:CubicO group peptidase (beta-lactamase class C family)
MAMALVFAGCGGAEPSSRSLPAVTLTSAAREGFDPTLLRSADRRLQTLPTLVSVLIMRHGHLVFERYYHGTRDQVRNVFSVTKSFTSALVGIAVRDGLLRNLDQRLVDFFPEKIAPGADPRVGDITLRDLLTMTAGYHETGIAASDDWVQTLINRPLATDPGTAFSYDSGSAHLLSAVLTQRTGAPLEDLTRRKLFEPLGIRTFRWPSDGQGRSLGGTALSLRAPDLLKFGQLYLQRGRWQGRQIVPARWVRESTTTQAVIPGGYAYGYLWWVNTGPHRGFVAAGAAGQALAVYPRLDLVMAITGAGDFDRSEVLRLLLRSVMR